MATSGGLRERKRIQTKQALHAAATKLFLERGFDQVTVAEIAEEANVALTTLFKYYPGGKVALVFDREEDREAELVRAIEQRPDDTDPLDAVEAFMVSRLPFGEEGGQREDLLALIFSTPQLRAHVRQKWTDCEDALAAELSKHEVLAGPSVRALARFILESPDIAARESSPSATLQTIFANLRRGWGL
ncbi:TetR/AcrR family transcriptional regulator [Saxibacter everestensis]|uniref:TetR/AcrR family transcriptional regulator n=1 Tax=Saxibacter everestensis TaxID=2909229 RepID=A0ABY8QSX9_9MICO|nr:TetR/AcrR family transcriptional regulator [Brevibacteriaceae bacterium ZFBP1038]